MPSNLEIGLPSLATVALMPSFGPDRSLPQRMNYIDPYQRFQRRGGGEGGRDLNYRPHRIASARHANVLKSHPI